MTRFVFFGSLFAGLFFLFGCMDEQRCEVPEGREWVSVDAESMTVENSVIHYEYHYNGKTNYVLCGYYGTAIGDFVDQRTGRDYVIGLDGCGTGFALVDGSEPVFSDVRYLPGCVEIDVRAGERFKTERVFYGLPVLEIDYGNVGCSWIDDGFRIGGDLDFVCYGMLDLGDKAECRSVSDYADEQCGHNFFDCFVRANWSSMADVLYKGHLIYGFVDRESGEGMGMVFPIDMAEVGDRERDRRYGAVKIWWDSEDCINTEMFTERGKVGRRWAFAVTGGRDEVMRIGKVLVDRGSASGLCMADFEGVDVSDSFASGAGEAVSGSGDDEGPSVPAGVLVEGLSSSDLMLRWRHSVDSSGAARYRVYRDGELVAETMNNYYRDSHLAAERDYAYQIGAYDRYGNESGLSDVFCVRTEARPCADRAVENGSFSEFDWQGRLVGWEGPLGGGSGKAVSEGRNDGGGFEAVGGEKYGYITQGFTLEPGRDYTIGVWVKCEAAAGAGASVRYVQLLPEGKVWQSRKVKGDCDWQKVELKFRSGDDYIDGRVDLIWDIRSGRVLFDDLEVSVGSTGEAGVEK